MNGFDDPLVGDQKGKREKMMIEEEERNGDQKGERIESVKEKEGDLGGRRSLNGGGKGQREIQGGKGRRG